MNLQAGSERAEQGTSNVVERISKLTSGLIDMCIDSRLAVDLVMRENPVQGKYISDIMGDALSQSEAESVAEAALVAYQVIKQFPPSTNYSLLEGNTTPKPLVEGSVIAAIEDDVYVLTQDDRNAIWRELQEEMESVPELANTITEIMRRSATLEGANLIGGTALVIYRAENFLLSLPPSLKPIRKE